VRRYTKQQLWEIFIVVAIIVLVGYRLALVYDFVPDQYQPSTILDDVYDGIKQGLAAEAQQNNMVGHSAQWSLNELKEFEKYRRNKQRNYEMAEKIAARCKENMLFRFFMFMGDEDNQNCSEQNMQLEHATKDVMHDAKKPSSVQHQKSNAPSAAAPDFVPHSTPATKRQAAPAPAATQDATPAPTPTPPPTPTPTPTEPIATTPTIPTAESATLPAQTSEPKRGSIPASIAPPPTPIPTAPIATTPTPPTPPAAPIQPSISTPDMPAMDNTPDYAPPTRAPVSVVAPDSN
jgi:hypothetical protein